MIQIYSFKNNNTMETYNEFNEVIRLVKYYIEEDMICTKSIVLNIYPYESALINCYAYCMLDYLRKMNKEQISVELERLVKRGQNYLYKVIDWSLCFEILKEWKDKYNDF